METRTIRVAANIDGVDFPNAAQIFQIEREVFTQSTGKSTYEAVYGITSLGPDRADALRLLDLNRGHWSIENRSHYVQMWFSMKTAAVFARDMLHACLRRCETWLSGFFGYRE